MARHTTVGSLLRSTQASCLQLCEKETFDCGIAYYGEAFPTVADVNQFREVVTSDPSRIPEAFEQAERWYRERNLVCHRWAPADGQPTDELAAFLAEQGFTQQTYVVMKLAQWLEPNNVEGIRVLPARAMRAACHASLVAPDVTDERCMSSMEAESIAERLNDPPFDLFVALVHKQPAGHAALYQVGDIGRVMHLGVGRDFADAGVERALLAHVLTLAKRLVLRVVCAQVHSADTVREAWFHAAGFERDGSIVEFDRAIP